MAEATPSSSTDLPVILGQEYRVKLGKSFTFPKENSFHTMKYDFKPQSVDSTKPGRLKVTEDEVNVSLPIFQAETVEDVAQFRGPKKSCLKECILIIDTNTGEAILEKISNTVQLKVIRKPRDRSVSPSPFAAHMTSKPQALKSQLATTSASHNPSPTLGKSASQTNKKTKKFSQPKSRMKTTNMVKSSESVASPKTTTTTTTTTTATKVSTNSAPEQPRKKKSQKVSNSKTSASTNVAVTSNSIPSITHSPAPPTNSTAGTNLGSGNSISNNSMSGISIPSSSVLGASMPLIGMELGNEQMSEISPIPSSNPTPEPVTSKKIKLDNNSSSSDSSSSSSGSDSDDSDVDHMTTNTQYTTSQVTSNSSHMTGHMMPSSQPPQGISYHNVQPPQSMPIVHQDPKQPAHRTLQQQQQQLPQSGAHMSRMQPVYPGHVPLQSRPIGRAQSSSSSSGSDSDSSSGSSSSGDSSDSSDQANNEVATAFGHAPSKAHSRQKSIDLGRDLALSDSDSDL